MQGMSKGLIVAAVLAVLTLAEYLFAVRVDDDTVRFFGLAATAILKTVLIVQVFMHFSRLWKAEAH
jgi:cytochrome c oxidase subunit IV